MNDGFSSNPGRLVVRYTKLNGRDGLERFLSFFSLILQFGCGEHQQNLGQLCIVGVVLDILVVSVGEWIRFGGTIRKWTANYAANFRIGVAQNFTIQNSFPIDRIEQRPSEFTIIHICVLGFGDQHVDHRQRILIDNNTGHIAELECIGGKQSINDFYFATLQINDGFLWVRIEDFLNLFGLIVGRWFGVRPFEPLQPRFTALQFVKCLWWLRIIFVVHFPLQEGFWQDVRSPQFQFQSLGTKDGNGVKDRCPTRNVFGISYRCPIQKRLRQSQAIRHQIFSRILNHQIQFGSVVAMLERPISKIVLPAFWTSVSKFKYRVRSQLAKSTRGPIC